jgi:hypothetical protein
MLSPVLSLCQVNSFSCFDSSGVVGVVFAHQGRSVPRGSATGNPRRVSDYEWNVTADDRFLDADPCCWWPWGVVSFLPGLTILIQMQAWAASWQFLP